MQLHFITVFFLIQISTSTTAYLAPGEPRFISKYLPNNYVQGQKAAKVNIPQLNSLNIKSYSGYITVDKAFNSNLFFWYFPCVNSPKNAPVALWLNGGPGFPSLVGLFMENGPISVDENQNLVPRKYSWTNNHHMIYIDSPVGTGYSFTNSYAGYANNQTIISTHLLSALKQFFQLFPNLKSNPFYLTGESYAGIYLPSLANHIFENPINVPINLKGMAIGNGVMDPVNQLNYGDYLYQLGLIDRNGQEQFKVVQNEIIRLVNVGAWSNATQLYVQIFQYPMPPYTKPLYPQLTGLANLHNYYHGSPNYPVIDEEPQWLIDFLVSNATRAGIHVGNSIFHGPDNMTQVVEHLAPVLLMSQIDNLCRALQKINVFLYNGQLDVQIAYPMMENYLQKLNCSGSIGYNEANRKIWRVGEYVAGYVKKAGNLTEILIRDAGHLVPLEQPFWSYLMIEQLTSKQNYESLYVST